MLATKTLIDIKDPTQYKEATKNLKEWIIPMKLGSSKIVAYSYYYHNQYGDLCTKIYLI